jgi:5'-methylthioadenosine phosphorylase
MRKVTARPLADIGIIGGSGLYEMEGLADVRAVQVRTPFGKPSDALVVGTLDGVRVAFLSRHGRGHCLAPADINYRANIYALKSLGVTRVISVSAVGSMKEALRPGDVVLPDQFIDLTKRRAGTFFEHGVVAHVAFSDPVCGVLGETLLTAADGVGATVHRGGTYLCIEGPQFSSRGESLLYRQWGVDVIGMTNMPEAKLAREAELCYATMGLVTYYDCWHESEEPVTVDMILATLHRNVTQARRILRAAVPAAAGPRACPCATALQHAIVTAPDRIPTATRRKLWPLIGKYLKKADKPNPDTCGNQLGH